MLQIDNLDLGQIGILFRNLYVTTSVELVRPNIGLITGEWTILTGSRLLLYLDFFCLFLNLFAEASKFTRRKISTGKNTGETYLTFTSKFSFFLHCR